MAYLISVQVNFQTVFKKWGSMSKTFPMHCKGKTQRSTEIFGQVNNRLIIVAHVGA